MKSVRILCTASIGYCAAVFLSHYLLFGESVIAVLSLPVMLALSAFLFRGGMRTRIIIAALAMTLGFGQYWLHYDLTVAKCEVFAGKETRDDCQNNRLSRYPRPMRAFEREDNR